MAPLSGRRTIAGRWWYEKFEKGRTMLLSAQDKELGVERRERNVVTRLFIQYGLKSGRRLVDRAARGQPRRGGRGGSTREREGNKGPKMHPLGQLRQLQWENWKKKRNNGDPVGVFDSEYQ